MYNYLNDAIKINFEQAEQYKICDCGNNKCRIKAKICNKCYRDPDAVSRKLYDDMCAAFKNVFKNLHVAGNENQWYLRMNELYEHELSVDYIGPSRAWAMKYLAGADDEKVRIVGDFLLVTRTLGGHVFWPAHQINKQSTINQARGGKHTFDRFDIALAELRNCYTTHFSGEFLYHEPLAQAFCRYKWFFELFGSFDNYISKMQLKGFLHNGEVVSLLASDLENEIIRPLSNNESYEPLDYLRYIRNCKKLIKERTELISTPR